MGAQQWIFAVGDPDLRSSGANAVALENSARAADLSEPTST